MAFLIGAAPLVAANSVGTNGRKDVGSGACRRFPFARTRVLQLVLAVAFSAMVGGVSSLRGEVSPLSEDQVKAAFLYNFAKFVEWPPEAFAGPDAPIVIGVVGADSIADALVHTVNDKDAQGRKFLVKRWKRKEDIKNCHILFISSTESNSVREILKNIDPSGVLTIGEMDGFTKQGGMINFVLFDGRVRFDINYKSAESAGLKISSKLLSLAKTVRE